MPRYCVFHGGGRRCKVDGCERLARGATDHCVCHGGGTRCCRLDAHVLDKQVPHAYFAGNLCWFCFVSQHPEKARCKVRKEHFVLAELERICPDVYARAVKTTWDCPVEGGCSLRRPDLLLHFGVHAVIIEVDEQQHSTTPCWDEDTRLAVIAADLQLPISVIRIQVDEPVSCFSQKRLKNGEAIVRSRTGPFQLLMERAAAALCSFASCCDDCFVVAHEEPRTAIVHAGGDGD